MLSSSHTDFLPSNCDLLNSFRKGDLLFGTNSRFKDQLIKHLKEKGHTYYLANHLNANVVSLAIAPSQGLFSSSLYGLDEKQTKHYQRLVKNKDYLIKEGGKPIQIMRNNPVLGSAFRRSCKILLREAGYEQAVHFELSGLDISKTCAKEKGDVGITNSELRAVYRAEMKAGPNPNIFFYTEGKSCLAPWLKKEEQPYWDGYEKKRQMK